MPAPTPLPLRKAIWHRHHNGQTPATIAHDLGLRLRTVQQLLRRGRGAIAPSYHAAAAPETTTANNSARRPSRCVASIPPGAPVISAFNCVAATPTPGCRRNAPYNAVSAKPAWGQLPRAAGQRPTASVPASPTRSGRWTPSNRFPWRAGKRVSWLRIVDEGSKRGPLDRGFPPGRVGRRSRPPRSRPSCVAPSHRWGRPGRFRVDNGTPWGLVGRLAAGPGVVADRFACRGRVEPGLSAGEKWGGGAVAGNGQALGGARDVRERRGTARASDGGRYHPA